MKKIMISVEGITLKAVLTENGTAQKIWDALPITGNGNRWGEEIYFAIPLQLEEESDARADVEIGELGYWAPGNAFCIFFGPTPASTGNKPRAASPVNIFGHIPEGALQLSRVKQGSKVLIEKSE